MKRFKGKKIKKISFLKIFIYLFIIILVYIITINTIFNFKLKSSNEEFIKSMLESSNHYKIYKNNNLSKFMNYILNIDLKSPESILKSVLSYEKEPDEETGTDSVTTNYIEDPEQTNIDNPLIYIYNTHQLESYNSENYTEYNITPNVQMASYLLKGLLNKEKINTLVETANINDFLSLNGWDYSYSYEASKYYLKDALNNYPNLKLIIDLHRDSISKDKSTVKIDNKNYAKVLFVVGTDYNYEENLSLANSLNNMLISSYPSLTRGVITKGGSGVNGVYNQDLSNKIVLIELGGNENTIDEVMNTIVVLKDIIKKYIGDING